MQTKELLKLRCDEMLLVLLGVECAETWWNTPNWAFGGLTPEGQWAVDPTTIYIYLVRHCSGDYY